jgi:hypothetical protein
MSSTHGKRLGDHGQENDTTWLAAELVRLGLTTADDIEQRATVALTGYVGGLAMLRLKLRDAVALALARQVEAERGTAGQLLSEWLE